MTGSDRGDARESGAQRRLRFRLIRVGAILALAAGITIAANVALLGYATNRSDPVGRLSTKAPVTTTTTGTTTSAAGTSPARTTTTTTTTSSTPARTTTTSSGSATTPTTTGGGTTDDHGGRKGQSGKGSGRSGGTSEDD